MTALVRSRIAPTPSGYLHLGNAFNFLLTEHITRRKGGSLLLRIDDLDAPRIRTEYIADVFDTLRWLGIVPDEGPVDEAGFAAVYSQQLRLQEYHALLEKLVLTGRVFACTCTRAEISRDSRDGQYPGHCRDRALPLDTKDAAWRFRTDPEDVVAWEDRIAGSQTVSLFRSIRDFVVRRRDGLPAYHVASLCDDVSGEINLIVRGTDLRDSTAAQLQLATALELDSFRKCSFYHHPLLPDESGEKLSKSAGSQSLKAIRATGVPAEEIRRLAEAWYRQFLCE